ncbi:unnamed protein product [Rangifer tarandus platyrhynchus]|uniref:Uncharacterized protein n=2 Tax=Rangifer tarandus platyrhynchus TaxID=3082113 RepID=A0ACB0EGV8_RANTA|nr:unnamed protein product [Rangifer tarandus platyrhynchus]CAI9699923.1 unnamed protein product [Rangifer tarandus platyrhynchus]
MTVEEKRKHMGSELPGTCLHVPAAWPLSGIRPQTPPSYLPLGPLAAELACQAPAAKNLWNRLTSSCQSVLEKVPTSTRPLTLETGDFLEKPDISRLASFHRGCLSTERGDPRGLGSSRAAMPASSGRGRAWPGSALLRVGTGRSFRGGPAQCAGAGPDASRGHGQAGAEQPQLRLR